MSEIRIIPPRYQGTAVPSTSYLFQSKYPAGLRCSCNNLNSIFHTLSRWKTHCKGKKHVCWLKSLGDDERQSNVIPVLKSQIKHLKTKIGRLSNDVSAYRTATTNQNSVFFKHPIPQSIGTNSKFFSSPQFNQHPIPQSIGTNSKFFSAPQFNQHPIPQSIGTNSKFFSAPQFNQHPIPQSIGTSRKLTCRERREKKQKEFNDNVDFLVQQHLSKYG